MKKTAEGKLGVVLVEDVPELLVLLDEDDVELEEPEVVEESDELEVPEELVVGATG